MLLFIVAASGLTDDFQISILGPICGGFIGSIAVDELVSALLLCASE